MDGSGSEKAEAPHWIDEPRNVALLLLLQAVLAAAAGLAIWWATGRELVAFVSWRMSDPLVGLVTAGALIGAMQAVMLAFPTFLSWAADQQRMLFENGRVYAPAHILLISLGAGCGEEALFRGGLQTLFDDHLPSWTAILLASSVFAALHFSKRGVFAFIFAYGVAFGVVYRFTGSLAGVMIAHTVFDIWAIAVVQRELRRQELGR